MKILHRQITAFLLIAFLCYLANSSHSSPAIAAQSNNSIVLAGLHAPVTVRRDERGIPYIEATNDEDLYFAQGYIIATDRLWQMDLLRRTVRGELAEIFGNWNLGFEPLSGSRPFGRLRCSRRGAEE